MSAKEATPFTIRDQLERDARRVIDDAMKRVIAKYKPPLPFDADLKVSSEIHNPVGHLTVRIHVEVTGNAETELA